MARKKDIINGIAVRGFKSIGDEQRIEIAPLTILAGANSSGKSSIMQPLLLLKQTLEAPGDPGALLLDGPNARFTSASQLTCKGRTAGEGDGCTVRLEKTSGRSLEISYDLSAGRGIDVKRMAYASPGQRLEMFRNMSQDAIIAALPKELVKFVDQIRKKDKPQTTWHVVRDRCFLTFSPGSEESGGRGMEFWPIGAFSPSMEFVRDIQSVIHLPGLRGNPRRNYQKTAVGPHFSGTFELYTASLISKWQAEKDNRLDQLGHDLEDLGLTWKVFAADVEDTQVELKVGRLPHAKRGGAHDLVSIADVGFGVSQSLPVLVALLAAQAGQLLYIEQPEIHLHPRAQRRMAHLLCQSAKRGLLLVVETHSALLIREIQTMVAKGQMSKDDVRLHWVQRNKDGETVIETASLDETGAYGDWPQDFDSTELEAEQAYLDAVEAKGAGQ
jgi:hypothetical protein